MGKGDAARRRRKPLRYLYIAVAVPVFALVLVEFLLFLVGPTDGWGFDLSLYQRHVGRFLAGGGLYEPWQLTGPYTIDVVGTTEHTQPSLYPPLIVPLVAPFLVLPAVLWWAIPLGVLAYILWRLRPSPLAWLGIGLLCLYPRTFGIVFYGNPSMWMVAAVAAGLIWRWPAVFVFLKPTLLVFGFVGVRSRSWWVGLGLLGVAGLIFLPVWFEYVTVLLNLRGTDLGYSLAEVPAMLIPVVAWLGRRDRRHRLLGAGDAPLVDVSSPAEPEGAGLEAGATVVDAGQGGDEPVNPIGDDLDPAVSTG